MAMLLPINAQLRSSVPPSLRLRISLARSGFYFKFVLFTVLVSKTFTFPGPSGHINFLPFDRLMSLSSSRFNVERITL
jgi:hypothetical protein